MIRLPDTQLAELAAGALRELQARVDAAGEYPERVARGNRLFDAQNRPENRVFLEVKRTLDRMCAGARRCVYCEDSAADEVEHVRPRSLYPELVFAWSNYVYACGPCNGPKGNHFAVFIVGHPRPVEVARRRGAPIVPPPDGEPALIDPRTEDATRLLWLDLRDTFWFTPLAAKGTRDHERASYTINTLGLNSRPLLPRARREAYRDYVAHLHHYRRERGAEAQHTRLVELRGSILGRQHPTVWREIQRQWTQIEELKELFQDIPEASGW